MPVSTNIALHRVEMPDIESEISYNLNTFAASVGQVKMEYIIDMQKRKDGLHKTANYVK